MIYSNISSVLPIFRFINVAFLIMPGAALVFDMPETLVGPNDVSRCMYIFSSVTRYDNRTPRRKAVNWQAACKRAMTV